MEELIKTATAVVGPQPGMAMLLFILCGLVLWAYWKEKTKNDQVADERIKETRKDVETVTEALREVTVTVKDFKASLEAVKGVIDSLAGAAKQGHELGKTLVDKIKT